ncbi:MAG: S-methyl-5-thioribose-1-phosphate isomerase [Nitrospirae bacterium CG_4_10_14_0_8_um_filter_41_23]|nr:S-methyl-5-thioribose-1-phosphate isomerase [Nitrospirota bacterium]OIP59637.1 MAG: S-methyl-5-thioribose-1-phosphate isomerase [Nitrospirae bacterium CG2_30_41_42]PIY87429.1 MAG: S-methyl-5-thioribose-1-phosphate isomerase [Nitrospirae bacterium CG_4_10_14_0_8_um_filter_41_23]PJA79729.1 MAG: S-methyl-5-thioribose-1-phosphate isomerase [Nitrospirae bacterium CG_4_9_14_3_um_filter_41_27]
MVKTIEWVNGKVIMLDQSRLPLEVRYIECTDYQKVAEGIKKLWIRGAPAIGIAAAMGIALGAQEIKAGNFKEFIKVIKPIFNEMLDTRPTAVNIKWAVERIRSLLMREKDEPIDVLKNLLIEEAKMILEEDIEVNKAIGRWGAEFIKDGDTILTHCNAGSLATGGYGTATAPMLVAKEQGKKIQVIADETRPVLQGARLTAWELMQEGIPVTLITDSTAGALMKMGEIDLVIVGTDRTARNGDVANKIGTYTVAVLCKEHKIPFYVAAPISSIDFSISSGKYIPIEERGPEEVTHIFGRYQIAPDGVKVRNIAFDVTPYKYITAIITEKGAFRPRDLKELMKKDVNIEELQFRP